MPTDTANAFTIAPVRTPEDIEAAIALAWQFFDFARSFPGMAEDVETYITHHQVREKFAAFDQHFLPPKGDCLLARAPDGAALGVVMLTAKSEHHCEMNRMFVTDAARGTGLGRALCVAIMARGRAMGFDEMTLDTVRLFTSAIALYRAMGFEEDTRAGLFGADNPKVVNMRRSLTDLASSEADN